MNLRMLEAGGGKVASQSFLCARVLTLLPLRKGQNSYIIPTLLNKSKAFAGAAIRTDPHPDRASCEMM